MNKWLVVLLIFSLAVNLAAVGTLLYLTRHAGPPEMRPGGPVEWPADARGNHPRPGGQGLGIPGAMKPEVEKLRQEFMAGLQPLSESLRQSRQRLVRLMDKQPAATDSIAIVLQKINQLQGEMEKRTVDHLLTIRPYLEEKQWQNLTRILQERMREFRPMRPDGPNSPPAPEGGPPLPGPEKEPGPGPEVQP